MKIIVISAVNLVEAGTLAILKDCLAYLSELAKNGNYRVIAIVYDKDLAFYPNIEYIETTWPKQRWINRLWFEYVSMKKISKNLAPVYLWLSLHDTSPTVNAEKRAVYCHNSFSFYKWKLADLLFAPKIALFAIFTKYIYKTNIHKNDYVIVQQNWFRNAMSSIFKINPSKIIVSPPTTRDFQSLERVNALSQKVSFIFAGSPNSHKNFEIICRAVALLNDQYKLKNFEVFITVKGHENKYAKWLFKNWGTKYDALNFIGFIDKLTLENYYSTAHCLIFPSKVETWGLPISEFAAFKKPMLLADLPYTHETASGASQVAYFNPEKPEELAQMMKRIIEGDTTFLEAIPLTTINQPLANTWEELFNKLLQD
ncbi:glycosyltransferase family 4 protein [Sphingobacteriaceae bacterium WQ 2009]|uniref:Glycosyltransferase family 4 protein n=1 Tax=Rhinopithecimicrobium faecis TaxID=2820698 RepID=A0A8T4H9K8_9SPHI|nr:glycosyltransferase family 4 protein [Sphingobacteriaceae bacterium WQ 2009]